MFEEIWADLREAVSDNADRRILMMNPRFCDQVAAASTISAKSEQNSTSSPSCSLMGIRILVSYETRSRYCFQKFIGRSGSSLLLQKDLLSAC